mmetsp:Transcript_31820/g.54278  ORF Transcript_31820/g.54278 Transcript_31820/m.54278 type:complete len:96 (-) Transcript_31820:236-523(-)
MWILVLKKKEKSHPRQKCGYMKCKFPVDSSAVVVSPEENPSYMGGCAYCAPIFRPILILRRSNSVEDVIHSLHCALRYRSCNNLVFCVYLGPRGI